MTDIFIICNILQGFINYLDELSNTVVNLNDAEDYMIFTITPEIMEHIKEQDHYFPTKKEMKLPQKSKGFNPPKLKGRNHFYHN